MAKYIKTISVEAEQFLPQENKIPLGVRSDGPRSPTTDIRSSWVCSTKDGTFYLTDGDYIVYEGEDRYVVPQSMFEDEYRPEEVPSKK